MASGNRGRAYAAAGIATVFAIAAVSLYVLATAPALPRSLPIFAGTVFSRNATSTWVATFYVSAAGARIVGAWSAYNVTFPPRLLVVNGTVASPVRFLCPRIVGYLPQLNGTLDLPVAPGPHTVFWYSCGMASRIVITDTVRVVSPSFPG